MVCCIGSLGKVGIAGRSALRQTSKLILWSLIARLVWTQRYGILCMSPVEAETGMHDSGHDTADCQQIEAWRSDNSSCRRWRSSGGLRRCWTGRRRCGPSVAPPSRSSTLSPNPSSSTSSVIRPPIRKAGQQLKSANVCETVIDCPHASTELCDRSHRVSMRQKFGYSKRRSYVFGHKICRAIRVRERVARGKPQVGDVIYCREGARFGNAARITNDVTLCLGQRMMLFRPNPKAAASEYLWSCVSPAQLLTNQATSLAGGSASPHVNLIRDVMFISSPSPADRTAARIRPSS